MLLALIMGLVALPKPFDFYSEGPYDPSIPRPETILHYEPGARHSTFRDQEMVFQALVAHAPDRVKMIEYGRTAEGRPLRIYVIGSPDHIRHLDQLRKQHEELSRGQGDPSRTTPIVWINECIHGNETASFEAAMWTAYNLLASRGTNLTRALDKTVVILNPVYNPDGHERYVVYYNSLAVGSADPQAFEQSEPSTVNGRLNHFRFDMNRDRIAFSQDETRAEFAEMLRWNPQVYIDQHGEVKSYFFPPEPMSINVNVDRERNAKWTNVFGHAIAKAFDKVGFSYFVRDTFDLYYPGYIDASNTLSGAIGMTHETDGGSVLARSTADGAVITLRQGMAKHFTSALAVVQATAENGRGLLESYRDFKLKAISGQALGKIKRVVMTARDPRPLRRLQAQLAYAGIYSRFALKPFDQPSATDYWTGKKDTHRFPEGSLIVDLAQPQGAFAKALLEPGQDFEPEFVKDELEKRKSAPEGETYPGPDSSGFYDFTGWSLPFAHGLSAWYSDATPAVEGGELGPPKGEIGKSSVGYAVPYTDEQDILAVAEATSAGLHALVSTASMQLSGQNFAKGAFLFLSDRNDQGFGERLKVIAAKHESKVVPLPTEYPDGDTRTGPGSESTTAFRAPKIGVVFGRGDDLGQVGAIWYLMERQFHLGFTPLKSSALSGNLSSFTTIVVPGRAGGSATSSLRQWVSEGGNLVVLGDPGWALGGGGFVSLDEQRNSGSSSGDASFRDLPGSLFRAQIDPRSYLSFGYEDCDSASGVHLGVLEQGNHFYVSRREGGSVVKFADDANSKLLSGWEWPEETGRALRNAVVVQDVPFGQGHVVIFLVDPTERAMFPGMDKLLLNAMFLGTQ